MISFEEFEKQFNGLVKDKARPGFSEDPNYKEVDTATLGDQLAGVRVVQILNELRSCRYKKKTLRFIHRANRLYQAVEKIEEYRIRLHLLNILHADLKKNLHEKDLPPVLRNHMYAYIIGKNRNIIKKSRDSKKNS